MKCADFSKSRCKCLPDKWLQIIRVGQILFLAIIYIPSQIMYGPVSQSYYESEWGIGITFFSLIFSALAPYKPKFQSIAVISSEMAMGFNILITPIFWIALAKLIFTKEL
jgi:hypothetical protein